MRVGIVINFSDPTSGGGYTFQDSVLEGLKCIKTQHQIFLLINNGALPRIDCDPGWSLIDIQACYGTPPASLLSAIGIRQALCRLLGLIRLLEAAASLKRMVRVLADLSGNSKPTAPTMLEKAVVDLHLDVVWFADPGCEVVSIPFFATVWDLEHRKQPYFPEVSRTGWGWDSREQHYSQTLLRAARIFTGTQTGKDEIVHYYGVNPANVVVNPFVAPRLTASLQLDEDAGILASYALMPGFLLYPAQFWPHKNHVNLLYALKIMEVDHKISPSLVLTGSDKGNLNHVRSVIADLGLTDRVYLLGFVPSGDLEGLYRQAALMVFPTFFGPDNIPPLEAFALGCPVVASDIPGAREQLGDAALFFDPARPDDIAFQISKALGSSDLRARLVEQGREAIMSLTPHAYAHSFFRVLDDFEYIRRTWRNDYINT
jgi:glycosyltransferase involved in cell wall biosynthesis